MSKISISFASNRVISGILYPMFCRCALMSSNIGLADSLKWAANAAESTNLSMLPCRIIVPSISISIVTSCLSSDPCLLLIEICLCFPMFLERELMTLLGKTGIFLPVLDILLLYKRYKFSRRIPGFSFISLYLADA